MRRMYLVNCFHLVILSWITDIEKITNAYELWKKLDFINAIYTYEKI